MTLPWKSETLTALKLTKGKLRLAIIARRKAIRKHRDQLGDNRCWLDDYWLYVFLDDSPPAPISIKAIDDALERCKKFFVFRRDDTPDPIPPNAITDRRHWDTYLKRMSRAKLLLELKWIQRAIKTHRDIEETEQRPRNIYDDRRLYSVLPERIPADFRLPPREEFIGEVRAPHAGCPAFIRSHASCKGTCNIHAWGPCKPS